MPDVGVLQLKISADAKSASASLRTLQTRLSEINTLSQNFNVSNVSTQIESIVKAVKGDKGVSTAVKNLGTLLNAIAAFSKVKGIGLSEDQVKQISNLQTAVSGFNLGQAGTQLNKLREALGGEWNTEQAAKAREALETLSHGTKAISESGTAEKIKDVSKSLDSMTGSPVKNIKETTDDIVDYQKAVDEMSNSLKDTQVTFRESFNGKGFLSKVMSGEYSTSVPSFENASVQNWRDTMNGIKEVNDGLKQTDTTSINSIEGLQETLSRLGRISGAGNLQKFADGIRAIENATKSLGQSYLTLNRLTNALEHLGNISANFRLPSFSKLESLARSLQENFNAENGLKRLADGIAYFNNATKGLDLSSIRGIASAIRSINSNAGKTTGASSIESFSASIRNVSNSDNLNGFVEASQRIADVTNAAKDAYDATEQLNSIIQQTGWSAQATAEQFYEMFSAWNSLRMNMSLNAGTNPLMLGDGTGGSGAEWAYWKDGAIEVEGTVSDAMETIRLEAGQTIPLLTGMVEENEKVGKSFKSYNVEDATEKVEALRRIFADSSDAIKQAIANIMGIDKNILFPETAASNVQAFGKEMQTAAGSAKELSDSLKRDYGKQMVEDLVNASSKADLLKMRIDSLKDSLARGIDNNTLDGNQIAQAASRIQSLQHEYDELIRKSAEAKDETKSLSDSFMELMFGAEGLSGAFKKMFPTLSGLLSRFKNLVKYRMLRAIIKHISEGFREGTENYYKYSEAIGGSFAPAMDSAVSSLAQMKNSIGAAAAPVIQALIPYLQMAVNWFITAINYANQFFALLGGQTSWSRAVPQTAKAFDKVKKSAGGAGSAIKDLLADWDELNIIQSESGGGGGGGGAAAMEDYLNMFEESSIFDEKIKSLVEFVKDNFDDILDVAKAIGVAILGWKVSNAFGGLLGKLGSLAGTIASIYLGVKLTDMFGKEYIKTGEPGWLVADALSGALGAYLAGKFAKKLAGSAFGYEVAGITLIIEGAINIKNAISAMSQQRDAEAWALDALGSIEIGIGAGLAAFGIGAGGPVSLAIGAAVAVGTFLITIPLMLKAKRDAEYKQMAIDAFSETNEDGISTEEYIKALQARADELTKGSKIVIDVSMPLGEHKDNLFKNLLTLKSMNALISSVDTLSEEDATKFKEAWHIVVEELKEIEQVNFETIYKGLDDVIANGSEKIKKEATALRKEAIDLARIMGGARGALQEEMNQLTNDIISGTLTGDEYDEAIARYEELYKIIAESEDSGMADLQKRIKEGASFDFSTGENPVDEAVNFIKTLSEQEINPVLEATKEAYDAELNAIEDTYKELEMLRKAGKLSDEEYNQSKASLDRIKKLYDDAYKDRVEQITALTKDAYETVMNQALAGLSNIDMEDSEAAKAYVNNVLNPIYAALEDAGYEIPKNVKVLMGLLTDGIYQFDPASVAGADRESIYEAYKQFADLNGEMDIEYPVRLAIAYEIDKNKGQPVDIASEAASDIINSLIHTFDYQMEDAFELMSTNFGWSFADIFSKINLKDLNVEQLEYLADTLAYLKEVSQENLNPSSGDYNSEYTGIEEEYNAIIEQIQQAIKEHTELPEIDVTQPVNVNIETDQINSDIGEALTNGLSSAFNFGDMSGTLTSAVEIAQQKIASMYANTGGGGGMPFAGLPSDITITETRDSGEEIGNTAEGTRQGTTELVTGQNTMNGYMQQVAMSTAGMVDSQGTANSYMAQMVSLLRAIASQGGGGMAPSVAGGVIAGAMKAFDMIRG